MKFEESGVKCVPELPLLPGVATFQKTLKGRNDVWFGTVERSSTVMKKMIGLLALLAAFPPLSTDMYLAAIPLLVEKWQQPLALVNMTLVGFFVTYCGFLLIYGPLSDRYGRRPPLLVGLVLYFVASLLCGLADRIEVLIAARLLQGAGAAAASSIAFAICKDRFEGNLRQRIFIQLGIIVAAAPMVAPLIGGWIIEHLSYRWVFVLQAGLGSIAFLGVLKMNESLLVFSQEKLSKVFRGYFRLLQNPTYTMLMVSFAFIGIPFFAFIAISSEIYISRLGYSEQQYGYFFGVNASAFMIAPIVFSRLNRHVPLSRLLTTSYLGVMLSSIPMLTDWLAFPYRLALPMWMLTFSFSFGRPPGNNLILEQVDRDVGSASSLMVFSFFLTGACAMWFISIGWSDPVAMLGWLGLVASGLTLCGWVVVNRLFSLKMP